MMQSGALEREGLRPQHNCGVKHPNARRSSSNTALATATAKAMKGIM